MCNKNITFLLCLTLLFVITFVSSAPPVTTVQQFPEGLTIVENPHEYLKLNQDYRYNFFIYNQSNGILMDNSTIECTFFLSDMDGQVLFFSDVPYLTEGYWRIDIEKGNFTESGGYPYGVSCQDHVGGALAGILEVTESGIEITTARSFLIIGLLSLLVFFVFLSLFSLFSVESYIGKFAFYWVSHVLMIMITFIAWQVGVEAILGGTAITGVFRIMFWVFTISVFPMVLLSLAWIFYIHTFNEHMQKMLEKGESPEDAFRMASKKRGWFHGN